MKFNFLIATAIVFGSHLSLASTACVCSTGENSYTKSLSLVYVNSVTGSVETKTLGSFINTNPEAAQADCEQGLKVLASQSVCPSAAVSPATKTAQKSVCTIFSYGAGKDSEGHYPARAYISGPRVGQITFSGKHANEQAQAALARLEAEGKCDR